MSAIQLFDFHGHDVRITDRDGNPWFVSTDIGRQLQIANMRQALSRLDDDEKGVILMDTPGGTQEVTVISESGLYRVQAIQDTLPGWLRSRMNQLPLPQER